MGIGKCRACGAALVVVHTDDNALRKECVICLRALVERMRAVVEAVLCDYIRGHLEDYEKAVEQYEGEVVGE